MPKIKLSGTITDDGGKIYPVNFPEQAITFDPPTVEQPPVEQPPVTPTVAGTIPLSKSDPRFSTNVAGPSGYLKTGTYTNKSWNQGPSYAAGEPVFACTGNGSDVLTINKAVIDAREGPRLANGSTAIATVNINESFINCVGKGDDHADGIQSYSPGGLARLNITNSCLRQYTDAEARSKYGTGFIGSCGLFWADNFQGEVNFNNVLIWGGGRGVAIYADTGTTKVSFKNVFFVPGPDGWTGFDFDIRATGGRLEIVSWENVRNATIKDGQIVPGNLISGP